MCPFVRLSFTYFASLAGCRHIVRILYIQMHINICVCMCTDVRVCMSVYALYMYIITWYLHSFWPIWCWKCTFHIRQCRFSAISLFSKIICVIPVPSGRKWPSATRTVSFIIRSFLRFPHQESRQRHTAQCPGYSIIMIHLFSFNFDSKRAHQLRLKDKLPSNFWIIIAFNKHSCHKRSQRSQYQQ